MKEKVGTTTHQCFNVPQIQHEVGIKAEEESKRIIMAVFACRKWNLIMRG